MAKLDFDFKSTKGSKIKLSYDPSGSVKISDPKAFEGYLKKVVDFIEVDDKPKPRTLPEEKPKPKKPAIAGVESTEETAEETKDKPKKF